MIRKILIAVFIVLLVVGALAGVKMLQIRKLIASGKSFVVPPETVSSAVVREEKWQGTLTAIGSVTAVQGVTVTPEIAGLVRRSPLNPARRWPRATCWCAWTRPPRRPNCGRWRRRWSWPASTVDRNRTLRSQNMISQAELDAAEATLKQTQGNADAIRATIEKKTIRAPFAGRLGIRLVNLGQYLDTGKPIVSLQSLTPVYADFSLPQQELARLKTGMRVRVTTDAYPGRVV